MDSLKILTFPYKVLIGFMILTQFLYYFGPIQFEDRFNFVLLLFFFVIDSLFVIGYKRGLKRKLREVHVGFNYTRGTAFIIVLGMLLLILQFINGWNIHSFRPTELMSRLMEGIRNPGQVFNERNALMHTSAITYVLILLSPLTFSAEVFSVFFWKQLGLKMKIAVVLYFILIIVYWLGLGTRKGLFDIVVILFFTIIISNPDTVFSRRNKRKLLLIGISFAALFIFYFVYSNLSRFGLERGELIEIDRYFIKESYRRLFPPAFNIVLAQVSSYLCQGYYALSLSLTEWLDHGVTCFTFGLGSNWFKINVIESLLPEFDILSNTYQGFLSVKYGIDPEASWHSLYLWLANDVTFIGVPIIIYILSFYCGYMWKCAVSHIQIVDAPIAILLIMVFIYSFANNQIFSFSFIAFWALVFYRQLRIRK